MFCEHLQIRVSTCLTLTMAPCAAPTFPHAEFRHFHAHSPKEKKNLCAAALFLQEQPPTHGAKSGAEFGLNLYVPTPCWTHGDAAPRVSTTLHLLGCMPDSNSVLGWLCVCAQGADACVCVLGMRVRWWRGRLWWSILTRVQSGRGRSTCSSATSRWPMGRAMCGR